MLCNIGLAICGSSHDKNKEPKTWLIKYLTDWLIRETEGAKKGCREDQHRDERNEKSQASLTHQFPGTSSQAHPSWTPWPFLQFFHLSGGRTPLLDFTPFRPMDTILLEPTLATQTNIFMPLLCFPAQLRPPPVSNEHPAVLSAFLGPWSSTTA